MKRLLIFAALLMLCGSVLLAQPGVGMYCATKTTALSGAAEVITVQQPATGATNVAFTGASVYASVDTGLTLQRDGTAAAGTTLAPAKLNATAATPTATAWSASDAGAGTTLTTFTVSAGQTLVLDLQGIWLLGNGTTKNLTLRTAAVTGTVKINICWQEY